MYTKPRDYRNEHLHMKLLWHNVLFHQENTLSFFNTDSELWMCHHPFLDLLSCPITSTLSCPITPSPNILLFLLPQPCPIISFPYPCPQYFYFISYCHFNFCVIRFLVDIFLIFDQWKKCNYSFLPTNLLKG